MVDWSGYKWTEGAVKQTANQSSASPGVRGKERWPPLSKVREDCLRVENLRRDGFQMVNYSSLSGYGFIWRVNCFCYRESGLLSCVNTLVCPISSSLLSLFLIVLLLLLHLLLYCSSQSLLSLWSWYFIFSSYYKLFPFLFFLIYFLPLRLLPVIFVYDIWFLPLGVTLVLSVILWGCECGGMPLGVMTQSLQESVRACEGGGGKRRDGTDNGNEHCSQ